MRTVHVIIVAGSLLALGIGGAIYLQARQPAREAPGKPFRPSGKMLVLTNDTGTQIFVDADTVRGDRQHRQGWVISDHRADKTMENGERKELFVVNCDTTGFRIVSAIAYKRDGSVRADWNEGPGPAQTQYAVPDSVGDEVIGALCDARYDAPVNKV